MYLSPSRREAVEISSVQRRNAEPKISFAGEKDGDGARERGLTDRQEGKAVCDSASRRAPKDPRVSSI
jgi:hypothetical protein